MKTQTAIQSRSESTPRRQLPARDNPLAMSLTTNVAFRFASHDWEFHFQRLSELGFRASIVGRRGSGKSTLLAELHHELERRGVDSHFVFLPQDRGLHAAMLNAAFERSRAGAVLLVDGIERLGLFQRRKLLNRARKSAGLVITKHHRCKLPTWIQTQTSPELMTDVLVDLNLDHPQVILAGQVAFEKHDGNIRNALRELYDQFAAGAFRVALVRDQLPS